MLGVLTQDIRAASMSGRPRNSRRALRPRTSGARSTSIWSVSSPTPHSARNALTSLRNICGVMRMSIAISSSRSGSTRARSAYLRRATADEDVLACMVAAAVASEGMLAPASDSALSMRHAWDTWRMRLRLRQRHPAASGGRDLEGSRSRLCALQLLSLALSRGLKYVHRLHSHTERKVARP